MNRPTRAHRSRRQALHARPLRLVVLASIIFLPLALGGCADPAANAPDAVVSEAAPTPEAQPSATVEMATYTIDTEASTVGFVGSKVTGSHDGGFEAFEGTIHASPADPTSGHVVVTIDTTSLWSDDERLTGHLKSEDFFAVEQFPTATFESTEIVATDTGYDIVGNLDLHGVTKQIRFPASITVTDDSVNAVAEFSIKRFDFGIEYPGRKDDLIRDEVLIQLDLTAHAT